jgi:hypothetical protein
MFKKPSQIKVEIHVLAAIATIIALPFTILAAWPVLFPPPSAVVDIPPKPNAPDEPVEIAEAEVPTDLIDDPAEPEEPIQDPDGPRGGPFQPIRNDAPGGYQPLDASGVPEATEISVTQNLIVHPNWAETPSDRVVNSYFPETALRARQSGRVTLSCDVLDDGALNCRVFAEDPAGFGFGEAALEVAALYRIRTELEDGTPARGSLVRFDVRFGLDRLGAVETEAWLCDPLADAFSNLPGEIAIEFE